MKNKKGFTLIEVITAIGLLALTIVCFSPLFLNSIKSINLAGDLSEDTYIAKSDIEKQLAENLSNNSITELSITYSHSNTQAKAIVKGEYIHSKENNVAINTFVAYDEGYISLSPNTVNELCKSNTQILITSDIIEFENTDYFKLLKPDGTEIPKGSGGIRFELTDNPNVAKLIIINNENIYFNAGYYNVVYQGATAKIHITPPALITVGTNGAYYAKNEEGKWVEGKKISSNAQNGKIGSRTLKDAVWTGTQYIIGGEYGSWYYSKEAGTSSAGESVWQSSITTNSENLVNDILYSEILSLPLHAIGNVRERVIIITYTKSYKQAMQSADKFKLENGGLEFFRSYRGKYVTDGYIGTTPISMEAYTTTDGYTQIYINGSDFSKWTLNFNNITSLSSNLKQSNNSEFVLTTKNKIYKLKPTGSANTPNGAWQDISNTVTDSDFSVVNSRQYYYCILDYNAKNNYAENHYIVFDEELPIVNKNILIDGVYYELTSGAGNNDKSDRRQIVEVATINSNKSGTIIVSDNINSSNYFDNILLVAGGDIVIEDYSNGAIISATAEKTAKWAGNDWKDNANNIEEIIKEDDLIKNKQTSKIIYMHNNKWNSCLLPTSLPSGTIINKVEIIGNTVYAVGDKGVVLSINKEDLLNNKQWNYEQGIPTNIALNAIAGWGL